MEGSNKPPGDDAPREVRSSEDEERPSVRTAATDGIVAVSSDDAAAATAGGHHDAAAADRETSPPRATTRVSQLVAERVTQFESPTSREGEKQHHQEHPRAAAPHVSARESQFEAHRYSRTDVAALDEEDLRLMTKEELKALVDHHYVALSRTQRTIVNTLLRRGIEPKKTLPKKSPPKPPKTPPQKANPPLSLREEIGPTTGLVSLPESSLCTNVLTVLSAIFAQGQWKHRATCAALQASGGNVRGVRVVEAQQIASRDTRREIKRTFYVPRPGASSNFVLEVFARRAV
ncbi:hypothetical protein CTAYLR_005007 [Chrysophaeum taylorii]|uniref:Uncharacterized protein n=1 Tax=Chrysophaeum taylorii TaxID=2483200 RepID=A0AAD7UAP1_9STRA|nr:hypothetical protein CTAYLR_005007 [Chrysophaeum taylorii]